MKHRTLKAALYVLIACAGVLLGHIATRQPVAAAEASRPASRPASPVKAEDGYQFTLACLNRTHEPKSLTLAYGEVLVLYGPEGEVIFECVAGE